MRLSHRVRDLLKLPDLDTSSYECVDCGVVLGAAEEECPECGGEIEPIEIDPRYLYWDPMM